MFTKLQDIKKIKHPPRKYSIQYARNNVVYLVAGFDRYQEASAVIREKVGGSAMVFWTVPKKAPLIHNGRKSGKK